MPTLSVIMPNYNHGRFLARAIAEIIGQSRPPDEFLILDDASTDDSARIIAEQAARYPRIRFLRNETNQGVIAAHKRLFEEAKGDYVFAGAADDVRLPGFFERAMALAECHPEAGLICGRMLIVDEHDQPLGDLAIRRWKEPLYASPEQFLNDYLEVEAPSHSLCGATIYRRAALQEVGWYRGELGPWGDTFSARAIGLKYGACFTPEPLTAWRRLAGSFSHPSRSDARYTLDLIARAARLMQSDQFRDRFPASHVARWRKRYRRQVAWSQFWDEGLSANPRSARFWLRAMARVHRLPGAIGLLFV
jgi:glycosyltransferase involved in cell wall biosynthesis